MEANTFAGEATEGRRRHLDEKAVIWLDYPGSHRSTRGERGPRRENSNIL